VALVEDLLIRRQQDAIKAQVYGLTWRHDPWGPRTWTRTEMEDMVYSSYKQMRQGRITRPPRRDVVMDLADYLNCTLEERNRLLIAADAPPIAPYLTGDKLDELLQITSAVARGLTMPAMILNRDWRIHFLNAQMEALYELTQQDLTAIPPERFNLLHLMFDPQLPLYPTLIGNQDSWARMVRQTIYGFKMANQLCQFEPWYQALVTQFHALPHFADHWNAVQLDSPLGDDLSDQRPDVMVEIDLPQSRGAVWLRPLVISAGYFQFDFPQIIAFVPADEEAQRILMALNSHSVDR
jgi:hypothetical protein